MYRGNLYVMTRYASCGRNFYQGIDEGSFTVKTAVDTKKFLVKGGDIVGEIRKYRERKTDSNVKIEEKTMYGKYFRCKVDGKIVKYIPFSHNRVHHGESKAKQKIFGEEGTLYIKKYKGRFLSERFVYKNRKTAYLLKKGAKSLKVYRPCGRLWAEYEGKIRTTYRYDSIFNGTAKQVKGSKIIHNLSGGWSAENLTATEYDRRGKIKHKIQFDNNQKSGVLIENYKKTHYVQGVVVSEKLYHAKPEEMDAREVMMIGNLQVRSVYIKQMGMERIYQQLGGEVIDRDEKNDYDLIKIDRDKYIRGANEFPIGNRNDRSDRIIKLLKVKCPSTGVYYTLRVPPDIETVERARQWTFGIDEARDRDEAFEQNKITFTKET